MAGLATTARVRDKEGKKRALLDAAADVFAESGFDDAATKEIARRAGCSESLIFRYFGDKQGIFEEVVSQQIAEGVDAAEDKLAAALPEEFDDFVVELFRSRTLSSLRENGVAGWTISGRALTDPAFARRVFLPSHQRRTEVIAECVEHYQRLGQVARDIDADQLAELLANLSSFTTLLAPRFFGTTRRQIRVQTVLAARVLCAEWRICKAEARRLRAEAPPAAFTATDQRHWDLQLVPCQATFAAFHKFT